MSVNINNKLNISTMEIKPYTKFKLNELKTNKTIKYINKSSYNILDYKKTKSLKKLNNMNKSLSSFLFQNNEVDMVRSLNPDSDQNLCDNLLFKENLINNMGSNDNFELNQDYFGQKLNLPKIKRITVSGILESEKKLNRNKKEAQRNLANNLLEKELYDDLKTIRKKYEKIKNKRNELYNNFQNIVNEINDISLDLKVIELSHNDNYLSKIFELKNKELEMQRAQREKIESENKFNQKIINTLTNKIPNSDEGLNIKKIQKIMDSNNDDNEDENNKMKEKMKRIKNLYLAKKEQDEIKNQKISKIKDCKNDIKYIEIEINALNKELIELRGKDNIIVQKLMKHFQALLYNGRDTRNEGLIWIIKSMWNLGKNVPMQFIPTFLDFKSIEFLFKLANKSIELENKKKILNEQKKEINIKLHNLYHFNKKNNEKNLVNKKLLSNKKNTENNNNKNDNNLPRRSSLVFKTNLIKKNSVLRNSVSESNFIKSYIHSNVDDEEQNENEPNTFKDISKIIDKNTKNYKIEQVSGMNDIKNMQKKIKEIEIEIECLKREEIKRIFKEFIVNDYKNKYHVSVDVVLSALLGEHMKNIEIHKFAKFKREYIESIKNLRFYEYTKHKDSN